MEEKENNRRAPTRGGGVWQRGVGRERRGLRSDGTEREPANVEAESAENEDGVLFVFPRGAPAPALAAATVGRTAQWPPLTPSTTSEGRIASPAPRSTASISGGSGTPVTVTSRPGSVESIGSGVPVVQASIMDAPVKPYLRLCWMGGKLRDSSGIVEGRTRRDVRHFQALHGMALVIHGLEMEV